MEQYLEEKKASQKRPTATFQRQDKKKTVYQTPQKPMTVSALRKCIPSLPVCIEDRFLDGCFFLLKMKDYDCILGLDWLEEHYALVDCVVGDVAPLEETVETDSERGD
ncbi:hypothetical protein Taro_009316 [Colocasia esculenta]|uniref:Uncharacterized protein n=1 Tax=Colocasia esculenta TaxID=4460 RepID=A0A843TW07_COLES|nr:hypothetical protein [Colocasia esculenta]